MFVAPTATAFWYHFHIWITKNMDLETASHFGTPKSKTNHKNVSKVDPRRLPKGIPESIKMKTQTQCVHWVPLWTLASPKWSPGNQKWSRKVSKITVLGIKSDSVRGHHHPPTTTQILHPHHYLPFTSQSKPIQAYQPTSKQANQPPYHFGTPKSKTNHKNVSKVGPRRLPKASPNL